MDTLTESPRTSRRTTGRVWNITLWILQVLIALGFLMAAGGKFSDQPMTVATFDALGFGDWFRYLIGALEVAGAVALLIPRLSGLASLAFVALMIGATVVNVIQHGPGGIVMTLPFLLPSALIAWGRRDTVVRLRHLIPNRRTTDTTASTSDQV